MAESLAYKRSSFARAKEPSATRAIAAGPRRAGFASTFCRYLLLDKRFLEGYDRRASGFNNCTYSESVPPSRRIIAWGFSTGLHISPKAPNGLLS
jgi:hypothetical protein